ncbi:hypothetical protein GGR56DRAFT_622189 [Xylariaceae sp. FL0804]|nr:hypothetical protein GGR56DRAFT_622189 [Xylariaceae sp. FL0804]
MTGRGGGSSSSRGAESQSSSSRGASRRLLRELAVWEKEAPGEPGIERLGPVAEDELLRWEAVINGRGLGGGYDGACLCLYLPHPHLPSPVVLRLAHTEPHHHLLT